MRTGFWLLNVAIVALVLFVVVQSPKTQPLASSGPFPGADTPAATVNPLDQVSSTNIALTVAQSSNLPETTAVANQAQTATANVAISGTQGNVVAKPQVVTTALKSRADIQTYVTLSGDSVSSVAAKFGITSDSVRWSNGLTGDAVAPGTKLIVPPINGIVYTVQAGDTADSLAIKFHSSKDQIVAYNDAEITGLTPGEQILIPNAVENSGQTAASVSGGLGSGTGFLWGNGPIYGYNGYDYGFCTWYVATQISVPANWGNASTWAFYAKASGWTVNHAPTVGAVGQLGGEVAWGEGHVAYVDAVSPDGTQIQYRDMNGLAGWGRVGQSGWVSASFFDNYISR
jgi:peptidoglycan endopeptidase LytE